MTISTFPHGFTNGLTVRGVPILNSYTGQVFYVNNSTALPPGCIGGSDGNPGTYQRPFATIDYAIGRCTANRSDIILVGAGHAETLSTAGAIAADVAGISIIGLGSGSDRPELTFGTITGASIAVSADNVTIQNIVGIAGIDGLTLPFNVTGDNAYIDIEWRDASSTVEAETVVRLDTANNPYLNLVYKGFTAGNAAVRVVAIDDCDNVKIDIDAYGVVSTAWVNMVDVASTNVSVRGRLYTQGVTNFSRDVVDTVGGSTWDAVIFDASAGAQVSGGSAAALAVDDVTAIASDVTTIKGNVGGVDSATNVLGADNNNNTFASTNVASNRDGSLLERSEYLMTQADKIDSVSLSSAPTAGSLARFVASGGTALGTPLADSKSLVDALGTNGTTVTDSAVSVLGAIGADNANNAFSSTSVVSNPDGSLLERAEDIKEVLYGSSGIGTFPAPASAANGVSMAEVLRQVQNTSAFNAMNRNADNYFAITADMTSATWNTQATHEIATVTGLVRMKILAECTSTLTDAADGASIQLGHETLTNAFIASTQCAGAGGNTIETGEIWIDAIPADVNGASSTVVDQFVPNGRDVGYEITGAALTGGTLVFHCWWVPISSTGNVVAGTGAAL